MDFVRCGNSAFLMLVSTIIPILFKNFAEASGVSAANSTAYGDMRFYATLIVALLDRLQALADTKIYKTLFILFFDVLGFGCAALALPLSWTLFLAYLS